MDPGWTARMEIDKSKSYLKLDRLVLLETERASAWTTGHIRRIHAIDGTL
jgi:hypothetical protein